MTPYMAVFIDAAFANNKDFSSQLDFLTTLMDSSESCNVMHYGSVKCKRVTRSALASELYVMVHGFDQSYVIKKAAELFLVIPIPLRIYTDTQSLFDSLTTLNTTSEKRLLIDLSMLRESYDKREIADVFWIPGDQNPPGALTKTGACNALYILLKTNKMKLTPSAWIERPEPAWANKDLVDMKYSARKEKSVRFKKDPVYIGEPVRFKNDPFDTGKSSHFKKAYCRDLGT